MILLVIILFVLLGYFGIAGMLIKKELKHSMAYSLAITDLVHTLIGSDEWNPDMQLFGYACIAKKNEYNILNLFRNYEDMFDFKRFERAYGTKYSDIIRSEYRKALKEKV